MKVVLTVDINYFIFFSPRVVVILFVYARVWRFSNVRFVSWVLSPYILTFVMTGTS